MDEEEIRVGWLGEDEDLENYPKGKVSEEFKQKLLTFCSFPINQMRGYHRCGLCEEPSFGVPVQYNGKELMLGSAEIRVLSPDDDTVYAAPNLIYHYVEAHQYQPPDEFIQATLTGPLPDSAEYKERMGDQ